MHLSKDQVQIPPKAFRPVLVGAPGVGVSLEVGECCLKMCQGTGAGGGACHSGTISRTQSTRASEQLQFPPVQKLLDPTSLPEQHSSSLGP